MAAGRINLDDESALKSMPTAAEAILRAAMALRPLLPCHDFYGETTIIWEDGRPVRMMFGKWSIKI